MEINRPPYQQNGQCVESDGPRSYLSQPINSRPICTNRRRLKCYIIEAHGDSEQMLAINAASLAKHCCRKEYWVKEDRIGTYIGRKCWCNVPGDGLERQLGASGSILSDPCWDGNHWWSGLRWGNKELLLVPFGWIQWQFKIIVRLLP